MATLYVYHGGGNISPYDSWANAATTLATALAAAAAGDTIIIAADHSETISAATTWTFPGGGANACLVYSADRTTGQYTKATAAQISATAAGNFTFEGPGIFYGVYFACGSDFRFDAVSDLQEWNDCTLVCAMYSELSKFAVLANTMVHIRNSTLRNAAANAAAGQLINISSYHARATLEGVTVIVDDTVLSPSAEFVRLGASSTSIVMDSCDLSQAAYPRLVSPSSPSVQPNQHVRITNTRLHPATTVFLENLPTWSTTSTYYAHNVTSANTVYEFEDVGVFGSATEETGIYRTAGASNGTTNYCVKVVTNASAMQFVKPYRFELANLWVDTSTAKTFTVHVAQDGTTTPLKDDEIWIEVRYPDDLTAAYHIERDRAATITTTPVDQPTTAEAWTGLSATSVTQKCEVTTTNTGKAGPCKVFLYVAKPSTTVYVCPKVEVA